LLVATAGHVDHGKTSLVKHLTGVDTDRLEEEKRRGLTIDLGFAYVTVNEETTLGFIDVPGHSRFINTMIAGVGGIDLGMLVVAADDGPMPQTSEHLQVMRLLGVTKFIIVVTKIDRVEKHRVDEVVALMRVQLPESQAVFPLSNDSGEGLAELLAWLKEQALTFPARSSSGNFRLAVDRAFSIKGVGLVVTGTAIDGQVRVGDELQVLPSGEKVRVRSLRVQNHQATHGQAGDRCALNIAGANDVAKGSYLVTPDSFHRSQHVDARFELRPSAPFPLKHLTPVRLYMGTRRIPARLYFLESLEGGRLKPGATALVQLIMEEPVSCCAGDHFLIRDDSETITLGGGEILDPVAPKVRKSRQHRLDFLAAMALPSLQARVEALLDPDCPPLDILSLAKTCNLPLLDIERLLESLPVQRFDLGSVAYAISAQSWVEASAQLQSVAEAWHRQNPQNKGITVQALKALFVQHRNREFGGMLFKPIVSRLVQSNKLALLGGLVMIPGHKQILSDTQQSHWARLRKILLSEGLMIPSVVDLASAAGLDPKQTHSALASAARIKLVCKITDARYAMPEHLLEHAKIVSQLAHTSDGITVIGYKNLIGSGRKLAIDILEYFDGLRYTQRRGDSRVIIDAKVPEQRFAR
jgi:selenocysteine-specific elongation factor